MDWTQDCTRSAALKRSSHATGRKRLTRLAAELKLEPGTFTVRSNQGGPAVSGEVTLRGRGVYLQISQPFAGSAATGIMFRRSADPSAGGDPNRFAPLALLDDVPSLARRVREGLGTGRGR